MSLGPLDLTGGPFLILYSSLLAAVLVAGLVIPQLTRPSGRPQRVTDAEQLAFLAGGFRRFSQSVVARLLAGRALVMARRNRFGIVSREKAVGAAEQSVVALVSPVSWSEIERRLQGEIPNLERSMIASGLLVAEEAFLRIRLWATLPYALLIVFGAAKLTVGVGRDRPVGFLVLLLMLTAAFAILRWVRLDRRTQAGKDAVDAARRGAERLRMAPTMPESGMAVALYGPMILAGSGLEGFHKQGNDIGGGAYGSGANGGGCGGAGGGGRGCGGGGGGCGGGGCGGCGG